jgi:hypothetical protein
LANGLLPSFLVEPRSKNIKRMGRDCLIVTHAAILVVTFTSVVPRVK